MAHVMPRQTLVARPAKPQKEVKPPHMPDNILPEIQALIISLIPRPSDLQALCMTTKNFQTAATPFLYNDVTLDLHGWESNERLKVFFDPGRKSLQYVRHLRFVDVRDGSTDDDDDDDDYETYRRRSEAYQQSTLQALRLILPNLTRDRLLVFQAPGGLTLCADILLTLGTQQRKLQKMSLGPIFDFLDVEPLMPPHTWLADLTKLDLVPFLGSDKDLDFYGKVLRTCPRVKEVTTQSIGYVGTHPELGRLVKELQDAEHVDGLLYQRVFRQFDGGASVDKRLRVERLGFFQTGLLYASRTWMKAIRFDCLRHLLVYRCNGAVEFLEALTELFKSGPVALRGFSVDAKYDIRLGDTLHNFLRSFSGLRYLQVADCNDDPDFDATSLATHLPTLNSVDIDLGEKLEDPATSWKMSSQDLRTLTQSAKRLKRVALQMPDVMLPALDTHTWGAFGVKLVRGITFLTMHDVSLILIGLAGRHRKSRNPPHHVLASCASRPQGGFHGRRLRGRIPKARRSIRRPGATSTRLEAWVRHVQAGSALYRRHLIAHRG